MPASLLQVFQTLASFDPLAPEAVSASTGVATVSGAHRDVDDQDDQYFGTSHPGSCKEIRV